MPARYAYSVYIFQETTDGPLEDVLKDLLREQVESDIRSDLLKAYDTASEQYSYLRARGFQQLAQVFWHASYSESTIAALNSVLAKHYSKVAQQIANALRVDPVAVEAIVSRQTDGRGVTEQEQVAAAMVLEVFCLLHKPTCIAVGQAGVVELLLRRASVERQELACACLGALLAVLINHNVNQAQLIQLQGIKRICNLLTHPQAKIDLRRRCAEFLNLLVASKFSSEDQDSSERNEFQTEAAFTLQQELGDGTSKALLQDLSWHDSKHSIDAQLDSVTAAVLSTLQQ